MNWFQKHLNWTMGIGILAYFVLGSVFLSPHVGTSPSILDRVIPLFWIPVVFLLTLVPTYQPGVLFPYGSDVLILFSLLVPVIWAFRQKKRSWRWLLLVFIPLGPIVWFWLKNKRDRIIEGTIRRRAKMSVSAGSGIQNQFRSVSRVANYVYGVFILLAILNVIAVISGYFQAELLNRVITGETITLAEATSNDNRQALIGFGQTAFTIAAAVLFLIWIHRAHKNLTSLHATDLRFTPGWAVGWFFVPIMSLFRPYQVASEIHKASDPNVDAPIDGTSWKTVATSPIVGWWWAFFLISNFIGQIGARSIFSGEELSDLLTSTNVYMVSDAIDIVGIIITILMVQRISQYQEAKYSLVVVKSRESVA